jgi:signal transduction histidine kinase
MGLLALHEGRLDIASTKGTGTTVTVRFPASRLVEQTTLTQ